MNILICEDNKLASKTLEVVLGKEGYGTDVAEDGNASIDKLDRNHYDLVLIDIHLPFHSGLEIVRHLRTGLGKHTPVIILTAFSDVQLQKQARELGITEYMLKPFNPSELVKKIGAILNN